MTASDQQTPSIQHDDARRDDMLWRIAMDYVLALRASPEVPLGSPMLRAQAEAWCATDPRHAAAFAQAEQVWALAGELPARQAHRWTQRGQRHPVLSRRKLFAAGGMAMAATAAGIAVLPQSLHWLRGDSTTGSAETRLIDLPDGGRITLGPRSALRLQERAGQRDIELLQGLAFFELRQQGPGRVGVQAGTVSISAPAGDFELRRNDDDLFLAVQQGALDLQHAGARRQMRAGDWLRLGRGEVTAGRSDTPRAGQWRDAILTVENQPVRQVAAEIARWHTARVLVLNDSLAQRQVSGVFDLTRPDAALRAMLQPFGGRIRSVTPWLDLIDMA